MVDQDDVGSEASTAIVLAEEFAQFARREVDAFCALVLLLPWSTGISPDGIFAPPPSTREEDMKLEEKDVAEVLAHCNTVMVPCTFDTDAEVAAAKRILPQFAKSKDVFIVMVHLFTDSDLPGREANALLLQREDLMFQCGASEVLQDPGHDAEELTMALKTSRAVWKLDKQRMAQQLSEVPEVVTADRIRDLQRQRRQLLWEGIPNALMPRMKPVRAGLIETGRNVGGYTYIFRYKTILGTVLKARDPDGAIRAIKTVEKAEAYHPEEVEDVYREFVFLSHVIEHPNIVRCLDMLHSTSRVYLVFEFAGDQNLAQLLKGMPEQRFGEPAALEFFHQLVDGLAFCHYKNLAHRHICMEHLAVDSERRVRLLDFRTAIISKGQHVSRTICGRLPCISPQVAVGKSYMPRLADSWSAGIILLEMIAGWAALSCAIPYAAEEAEACSEAPRIHAYFEVAGSHAAAFSRRGVRPSNHIIAMTQALLALDEKGRIEVQQLLRTRQIGQHDQGYADSSDDSDYAERGAIGP